MQQLHLKYDQVLNGSFSPKKINLLFTFQVNCHGCFSYGFPLVNAIQDKFQQEIGYLGLSTAFEDFDMNTSEHTKQLVDFGVPVGETKKMLTSQGLTKYPETLDFPIAMDHTVTADELEDNSVVDKICQINPDFHIWAQHDQDLLRQKVSHYLRGQSKISFTFTVNQFRGTPTFVIFNDKMDILHQWFGHVSASTIEAALKEALKRL